MMSYDVEIQMKYMIITCPVNIILIFFNQNRERDSLSKFFVLLVVHFLSEFFSGYLWMNIIAGLKCLSNKVSHKERNSVLPMVNAQAHLLKVATYIEFFNSVVNDQSTLAEEPLMRGLYWFSTIFQRAKIMIIGLSEHLFHTAGLIR